MLTARVASYLLGVTTALMSVTVLVHAQPCQGEGGGWIGDAGAAFTQTVSEVLVLASGEVVVAGNFQSAGGVPANRIALWDGVAWRALGGGLGGFSDIALAQLPNGDLIAGGNFTTAGGVPVPRIARWDGVAWAPLAGGGTNNPIRALAVLPNGTLVAAGNFQSAGGVAVVNVAR